METEASTQATLGRVRFFYIKSPLFRVVHVDGALGGITPRGFVHCAIYSERPAIPQATEHEINPEGRLGSPVLAEGKKGIVRELDMDLIMSKQTAIEFRQWLGERIDELERLEREGSMAVRDEKKDAV